MSKPKLASTVEPTIKHALDVLEHVKAKKLSEVVVWYAHEVLCQHQLAPRQPSTKWDL